MEICYILTRFNRWLYTNITATIKKIVTRFLNVALEYLFFSSLCKMCILYVIVNLMNGT